MITILNTVGGKRMQIGKATVLFAVCFIGIFWVNAVYAADVAKIGVVDMQRLLETSESGKAAQAKIKAKKDKMEQELKQKGAELEELRKQLEREAMVMSKEKRAEKEREGRIKLNDFKTLQKSYRAELQALEKELVSKLRKDTFELIEEIGKKEGYLLIINNFSVMYSPGSIDITDRLIKELNARSAKTKGN
jgi:outer membrane protein